MTGIKPLSRRDFLKLSGTASMSLALSSCVSSPTATPLPTVTPAPSPTPPPATIPVPPAVAPTATRAAKSTAVPMMQVDGLTAPDPRASKPELFDLASPDSAIVEFAGAFRVNPKDVGDLTPRLLTGKDNKPLIVLTARNLPATTHYDEADTPLIVGHQGSNQEWIWAKATIRPLADVRGMSISAPLQYEFIGDPNYMELITPNINKIQINGGLDIRDVFANFTPDTWQTVLDNWASIKKQLDDGVVPGGFDYNWQPSAVLVDFAKQHNMPIRVQHLLLGQDAPDSVLKSNLGPNNLGISIESRFGPTQLSRILEYAVKIRVLQYKGQILEWDAADEAFVAIENVQGNGMYGFWFRHLGGEQAVVNVARWARQADPSAKLVLVEDHLMEKVFSDLQPALNDRLFTFLRRAKAEKIPIDGVDCENNLWIYSPPTKAYVKQILKQISDLGFYNATPESTVIAGRDYPIWWEEPAKPIEVDDPQIAQAVLYQTLLEAYLEAGTNSFGFGDLSDAYSWYRWAGAAGSRADGMILDRSNRPKPAYYALMKTLFTYAKT